MGEAFGVALRAADRSQVAAGRTGESDSFRFIHPTRPREVEQSPMAGQWRGGGASTPCDAIRSRSVSRRSRGDAGMGRLGFGDPKRVVGPANASIQAISEAAPGRGAALHSLRPLTLGGPVQLHAADAVMRLYRRGDGLHLLGRRPERGRWGGGGGRRSSDRRTSHIGVSLHCLPGVSGLTVRLLDLVVDRSIV